MKRTTLATALLVSLISGCGSSSNTNSSALPNGNNDLETYLKQGFSLSYSDSRDNGGQNNDLVSGGEGTADAATDGSGGSHNFSTTNTQENGVDEADLIKQNGDYLYAVRQPTFYWPEVTSNFRDGGTTANSNEHPQASIEIYRTETGPVSSSKVGSYTIDHNSSVHGLYLLDDQLVVLGDGYIETAKGDPSSNAGVTNDALYASPWYWRDYNVDIQLLDISNSTTPQQNYRLQIEGSMISSRRIGNELYLATRFTPNIQVPWASDVSVEQWNADLDERPMTDFLPRVWKNGEASGHLFTDGECHLPDLKQGGYPSIVAVIRVNLEDPSDWEAKCNSGRIYGVYASSDSFVVTGYPDQDWDATRLDMYDLKSMTLTATGSVPGTLDGNMPSFRISERNGRLRVITSSNNFIFADGIDMVVGTAIEPATNATSEQVAETTNPDWDHRLFVLEPNDIQGFNLISSLPNTQRPAPIGKPNEQIQSVRFRGDRAYVVTFRRTDPLYVLNLSDDNDPFIEGELEIEGFSAYLEPVSDNLLLGLGRAADSTGRLEGLKVSLFDTSNPALPTEITSYTLGERSAQADALFDHHAISFLQTGNHLRMAFTWHGYDENWQWSGNRIHVADIDISQNTIEQKLDAIYESANGSNGTWYYYGYTRAPLHADGLHLVNNGAVTSGPLSAFAD